MSQKLEIKVCGMREASNIDSLAQLEPDYIGYIFYGKSPRFVSAVPKIYQGYEIKKAGVFVNASEREINEKRIMYGLDLIQLHGDESPEMCFILKQTGAKVMKVFRIDDDFDFQQTRRYEEYCDYFMFDTAGENFGGSGRKFNWDLLKKYNNARPVFISGGIGVDDIDALKELDGINIKAVDVNSRFEVKPALKDIELLSEFIKKVRNEE